MCLLHIVSFTELTQIWSKKTLLRQTVCLYRQKWCPGRAGHGHTSAWMAVGRKIHILSPTGQPLGFTSRQQSVFRNRSRAVRAPCSSHVLPNPTWYLGRYARRYPRHLCNKVYVLDNDNDMKTIEPDATTLHVISCLTVTLGQSRSCTKCFSEFHGGIKVWRTSKISC